MKPLIIFVLLFVSILTSKAQESCYDYIGLGKYNAGYYDTIIYDEEVQYDQYGYHGTAPLFVQVWFPFAGKTDLDYLKFGDFRFKVLPGELSQVYRELSKHLDESFIRDGITYNILTGEPIDYGSLTANDILSKVKLLQTRSTRLKLKPKLDYPVIIYHHGSQGMPDENSIMAEYFASRGYIFISANFHLPYPNTSFGLLPYALEKENKHNQSGVRTLINFARAISLNRKLFFIGHSWGAQEGWCLLDDPSLVNGFVSMETTIEFKTDTVEIKDKWPYVYNAIKTKKNKFSIPILLFASADDDTNFDFFKGLSSEEMVYASFKEPFAHNSYTSFYMMRYFLHPQVRQADSATLLTQIKGYAAHLDFIHAFLEHVRTNEELDQTKFREWFYLD